MSGKKFTPDRIYATQTRARGGTWVDYPVAPEISELQPHPMPVEYLRATPEREIAMTDGALGARAEIERDALIGVLMEMDKIRGCGADSDGWGVIKRYAALQLRFTAGDGDLWNIVDEASGETVAKNVPAAVAPLLLASAELYSALDKCVHNWGALGGHADDWLHEARAALAKARGESA